MVQQLRQGRMLLTRMCQIADRKRHKPDCCTDKKTTKQKRKEAKETFEMLTQKNANGMKLADMPDEDRLMHHFFASLRDNYKLRLKGDTPLRYHLGCNFGRDPDGTLFQSARQHVERMNDNCTRLFGTPFEYRTTRFAAFSWDILGFSLKRASWCVAN